MPFCTECGARLDPGSHFCTECGSPQSPGQDTACPASVSPAPPSLAANNLDPSRHEGVIQVIPNLMRVRGLGFLFKGPVWHHLVVTSERIIIVQKTVKGLERFKQDLGIIGPDYEHIFMKSMKPDVILGENPESRVIPLGDLMYLAVRKFTTYSAEEGTEYYWQVDVATDKDTLTLKTDYGEDPGEYFRHPALMHLLGDRLDIRDM